MSCCRSLETARKALVRQFYIKLRDTDLPPLPRHHLLWSIEKPGGTTQSGEVSACCSSPMVCGNAGCPFHDHNRQTKIGMVRLNHHSLKHDIQSGKTSLPTPGYKRAVVDDDGNLVNDRTWSPYASFQDIMGEKAQIGSLTIT